MWELSRRQLLAATALSALASGAGRTAYAALCLVPGLPAWAPGLLAITRDLAGARALGERCLAEGLAPRDAARIASGLFAGAAALSPRALAAHLRAQRARDFASGRTALLGGWVLAQSEVDRVALLALLPGDARA